MILIRIHQVELSDSSKAYNVALSQEYGSQAPQVEFHAITETDAASLADTIKAATEQHSVEDIRIRYCY